MAGLKGKIKKFLCTTHLYEPVYWIWSRRPDGRLVLWNLGYRISGAGDHLPIPPVRLIDLTVNSREIAWFLHTGMISFNCLCNALEKNGYTLADFHRVLDFGCGCGRVLRYWRGINRGHLYGCDYNPDLVKWDQSHLNKLANFQTNALTPPLNYPDNYFDFVYALSVFTHFPEDLQTAWMDELYRIIGPDGLLYVTFHGESRLLELNQEQRASFLQGNVVVINERLAGANACGAYNPVEYVLNKLACRFEPIDFLESGARDSNQDIYLLHKPEPQ